MKNGFEHYPWSIVIESNWRIILEVGGSQRIFNLRIIGSHLDCKEKTM